MKLPAPTVAFLVAPLALLFVAAPFSFVAAEPPNGNPCLHDWTGPNATKALDCKSGPLIEWVMDDKKWMAPVIVGLLALISCPFIWCFRYCCQWCGGSKMRPGGGCCGSSHWDSKTEEERLAAYSASEVRMSKVSVIGLLLVAFAVVILAYVGTTLLIDGIREFVDGVFGAAKWALSVVDGTVKEVKGNAPGELDSALQEFNQTVTNLRNDINDREAEFRKNVKLADIFKIIAQVIGYPSLVPLGLAIIGVFCAFMNIRSCLPAFCVFVFFALCPVYGVGSGVFIFMQRPIGLICDEINAQKSRSPGVFQWYVLPRCNEENPMAQLKRSLDDATNLVAARQCRELDTICSPSLIWSPMEPEKMFVCSQANNCSTLADLRVLMNSMYLKVGSPETCGGGIPSDCTVTRCASQCSPGPAQSVSQASVTAESLLVRVNDALTTEIGPYIDCNAFIDRILTFILLCNKLPSAASLLGSTFSVALALCISGIFTMWMGSKRFFNKAKFTSASDSPYVGRDSSGQVQTGMSGSLMEEYPRNDDPYNRQHYDERPYEQRRNVNSGDDGYTQL